MGDVLSGEFENTAKCEHRIWRVKRKYGLSPNPYNGRKSKSKRKNPSILALFVFINELMLTHRELASPWFLASLHELNCNEYHSRRAIHAVYCNSWYAVSIHATPLQFIACSPLRRTRIDGAVLFLFNIQKILCYRQRIFLVSDYRWQDKTRLR